MATDFVGIAKDHPRTLVQFGEKHFVCFGGDFGIRGKWVCYGPKNGCATKEEAESVKDNDELIADAWTEQLAT